MTPLEISAYLEEEVVLYFSPLLGCLSLEVLLLAYHGSASVVPPDPAK